MKKTFKFPTIQYIYICLFQVISIIILRNKTFPKFQFYFFPKEKNTFLLSPDYLKTKVVYGLPIHNIVKNYTFFEKIDLNFSYSHIDKVNSNYYGKDEKSNLLVADPDHFNITVIKFKNVFITNSFGLIADGHRYALRYYKSRDVEFASGWNNPIGFYEDRVIAFGHRAAVIFGHFFFDVMTPLMLLPDEVLYNSKILLGTTLRDDLLDLLDIPRKNRIHRTTDLLFAKTAYLLYPAPHISIFGTPIRKLRTKIAKKLDIDKNLPDNYVLMNRKSSVRFIEENSFKNVYNFLILEYPQYKWSILNDNFKNINQSIKYWNSIKFIVSPTGSNLMYIMFMQELSCIVSIQCNCRDTAFNNIAMVFNLFMIAYSNGNCEHFQRSNNKKYPIVVNNKHLKRIMKVAMYANEYKKFPERSHEYIY